MAIDDAQAAAIWRQRAKDETWGKLARYATFLPIRVALVGLATWQGGASWGLTSAAAYEMLDQGAERAAMRSPEIGRNLEAATVDNVSVGVGETGTVTAWASAAQVKSLAYEQRTRYQWLAGGVPESMRSKVPTVTQPAQSRSIPDFEPSPVFDSTVTHEPVTEPPESPMAFPIPPELAGLLETDDLRHPRSESDLRWIAEWYRSRMNEAEAEAVLARGYQLEETRIAAK